MRQEIFRMERVTYMEGELTLLEDFYLQVYRGEIMGLLPVNAYGLSAFLRLLATNLPLYDGYIYYSGEKVNTWKGSRKTANRISVIGARSSLVEGLSVSDNIYVLRPGFRQEIVRTRLLKRQLAPFMKDIDMNIPADARVEELPAFERVIVELLRAVAMGHRLIVFNEISTVLSYEELGKLHRMMRHYTGQGFSFLYICLHYEEIERVCDRTALFSHGHIQKILETGEFAARLTYRFSTEYGRRVRSRLASRKETFRAEQTVLEFRNISCRTMQGLDFSVFSGECLVIQALENEIFREMRDMLLGSLEPESGEVLLHGKRTRLTASYRIAVIQELPTTSMLFPELSYMENLCMSLSRRMPSVWRSRRLQNSIRQECGEILGKDVFDCPVEELSEKQKYQMIYMRVLLLKPEVVFCIQPFKGADLQHRMVIWEQVEMLLKRGIAVVLLALNLADSLSLADRLLILEENGKHREIPRSDFAGISAAAPWLFLYRGGV